MVHRRTFIGGLAAGVSAAALGFADASAQASELNDADSAAILTEIGRGIDKWLWLVSTNQQSGS